MYVCLCVGLTEEEIASAIRKGSNTIDLLMDDLGVSLGCSICSEEVERILIDTNNCACNRTYIELPILS